MHGRRLEQILTGTALALVLGLTITAPAAAQGSAAADQAAIEAKVPLPESANLPPPSLSDVAPETTGSTAIVLPDPPDLPPPTFSDVAAPAPAATPAPAMPAPAAAAPATPAPPAAVVNADQPIRDALREFIGSNRLARIIDKRTERTAVEAFYASRDYAPMFVGADGATERAKQTIAHLRNADADGMDPNDYPVPSIQAGSAPPAMAEAEMRLVESVLDYARQAQMGRVHYSRVSADISYELTAPAPLDVLSKVAASNKVADAAQQLSAAAGRLQGAAQEARRSARPQGRRARGDRTRPGARAFNRQAHQADRPDVG